MTKKLDSEIRALRACERALRPLSLDAKDRATIWLRGYVEHEIQLATEKDPASAYLNGDDDA